MRLASYGFIFITMNNQWTIPQLRYVSDQSFFHFVRIVGAYSGRAKDATTSIHKPLADFWQKHPSRRKCIFTPRGWFKSSMFTIWGAIWYYLQHPGCKILIISQREKRAMEFLGFIKTELLRNKILRKIYPDILGELGKEWFSKIAEDGTRNRWSDTIIDLPNPKGFHRTSIESIGVGSAAQGGHSDLVIVDDPVGKKHIESPTELEKVFAYHDNIKELLVNPNHLLPEASIISIHCTFWGPGDYGCYIMEAYPEYHWRIVPALRDCELKDEDNIKWLQNPEVEHDECNWVNAPPELGYSTEYYKQMRANPEQQLIFFAQQQNNPQAASVLTKIDRKWFRYYEWGYDEEGNKTLVCDDGETFLLKEIPLYGMADPAGFAETKQMKRGARNAIIMGGQPLTSTRKFITYAWAKRLKKPSDFVRQLFTAHAEQRPRSWRIDTTGNDMYAHLIEAIQDKKWREDFRSCATVRLGKIPKDTSRGSKETDMIAVINVVANGQLFVHRTMYDLIEEMVKFPLALTRDMYDMVAKLNRYYFSPKIVKEEARKYKKHNREIMRSRGDVTGYGF